MARTAASEYVVVRAQDGAQVRAELTLKQAREECAMLNAQARLQVGTTAPVYDERGGMVQGPAPIFGSMTFGQVSMYEVRSTAGLVIS
jgi:hypothetical protein